MNDKFISVFEGTLATNRGGEARNILITDNCHEFRDHAICELRDWALKNEINLVELDEKDDSWIPQIRSREFLDKFNQPNTVLLIKNYATTSRLSNEGNTTRNFLWEVVVNRHYGCENDLELSYDLDNLLFVVAVNDRSLMHWFENEYSRFNIMLGDASNAFYLDTSLERRSSKMGPVLSIVNRQIYFATKDYRILSIDAGNAFKGVRNIRYRSQEDRTDMIHSYINNNLPSFYDKVNHIIIKIDRFEDYERFTIDAERLRESFPNIKSIDCSPVIEISNVDESIEVSDPFELGERAFTVARGGDFETANFLTRRLWELDHKWAKFYREVAVDYQVPRERHDRCYPDGNIKNTGLDKLFRIYLLGWYTPTGEFYYRNQRVYAEKHQNVDKAIELLQVRFKNWDIDEIIEKLYFDLDHVEIWKEWYENKLEERDRYTEEDFEEEVERWKPDYSGFTRTLIATDHLYPGIVDKMYSDGRLFNLFN